jgi:hypothetical protein
VELATFGGGKGWGLGRWRCRRLLNKEREILAMLDMVERNAPGREIKGDAALRR